MSSSQRAALLEFVHEHSSSLFCLAFALTGRQTLAEELLQTSVEQLLARRRAPAVEPGLLVRRLMCRRYASPWRLRYRDPGSAGLVALPGGDDPWVLLRCLYMGFRTLSRRQRVLLALHCLDGLDEAAAVLRRRPTAVAADASAAFAMLARLCGGGRDRAAMQEQLCEAVRTEVARSRPVDVTELAVAGARRRRLVRLGAAVAASALVVGLATIPLWYEADAGPVASPTCPAYAPQKSPLAGRTVVVSYLTSAGTWHLLDAGTGGYTPLAEDYPLAVSPELCQVAYMRGNELVITPISGASPVQRTVPVGVDTLAWSPDGNLLAGALQSTEGALAPLPVEDQLRYWRPDPGGKQWSHLQVFQDVLLVNAANNAVRQVRLNLPPDRIGAFGGRVVWLDDKHVAAATAPYDQAQADARRAAGLRPKPETPDAVTVFNLDGAVVRQLPVLFGDDLSGRQLAGLGWELAGPVDRGTALILRWRDAMTVELTSMTLATTQSRPMPPVQLTLPEPTEGYAWFGEALAWDGDVVVFQASQHLFAPPAHDTGASPPRLIALYGISLSDGDVWQLAPTDLPAGAQLGLVGDAGWLTAGALDLAATIDPSG